MILESELIEAGKFNKPHGIKGEISATVDIDIDFDELKCVVMPIEGIFVPFFINSVRPKNGDTYLVTIDGVDSEVKAQRFTNRPFFILKSDAPVYDEADGDGFYAADLVGYKLVDSAAGYIGEISDINDSTQNVLFVVRREDGGEVYVPVVDEFIISIDADSETVETTLPFGIVDLNK